MRPATAAATYPRHRLAAQSACRLRRQADWGPDPFAHLPRRRLRKPAQPSVRFDSRSVGPDRLGPPFEHLQARRLPSMDVSAC